VIGPARIGLLPPRPPLSFAAVNRPDRPGYVAGLQRHHLIPRALVERRCFAALLGSLAGLAGLHDFRRNGVLLPASEEGAMRMGLPLHRGPHRDYSAMVAERLGAIESRWSLRRDRREAARAIATLQARLRLELLSPARSVKLHNRDPLGSGADFSRLDALADALWGLTQPA